MFSFKLLLAAACLASSALSQTATKLKIMPLGDSITEITCWRPLVWEALSAANLASSVSFVGSMTNNPQNCASTTAPNWDKHHEGHSGYTAISIAQNNLAGWLSSAKPDVVMFMLGTNGVNGNKATSDIIASYTKMVSLMRASNKNMKIIVDLVIPFPAHDAQIKALNAAIPGWATAQNQTSSPIFIADCNTGFTSSMLRDGIHPNAQGDAIIGRGLSKVLVSVVKSALNGTA